MALEIVFLKPVGREIKYTHTHTRLKKKELLRYEKMGILEELKDKIRRKSPRKQNEKNCKNVVRRQKR